MGLFGFGKKGISNAPLIVESLQAASAAIKIAENSVGDQRKQALKNARVALETCKKHLG